MQLNIFILTLITTVALFSNCINGNKLLVSRGVAESVNAALRITREQLGIPSDGDQQDLGWNLTFSLSGSNLGQDTEPYVKATYRTRLTTGLIHLGETTSPIDKSSTPNDPIWNEVIWFLRFENVDAKWHFSVYDRKNNDALIGEGVVDVDQYIESGQNYTLNLRGGITGAYNLAKLHIVKTTPIKFKLSAKNLPRHDDFGAGRSDPFVKVYFRRGSKGENIKIYTTSVINNVHDAEWPDVIEFPNYQRGTGQFLFFKIRDKDTVTRDDHLGEATLNVDEYINQKGPETVYLEHSGEHSVLTVTPA